MRVIEVLYSGLVRTVFRFERFFPYVVRLFANRKLSEYKAVGRITDYQIRAGRQGKHHYLFQIDLALDEDNIRDVITGYERKS
jgi:hypothetical protein